MFISFNSVSLQFTERFQCVLIIHFSELILVPENRVNKLVHKGGTLRFPYNKKFSSSSILFLVQSLP